MRYILLAYRRHVRRPVLLIIGLLILSAYYYYLSPQIPDWINPTSSSSTSKAFSDNISQTCVIPKVHLYHKVFKHFIGPSLLDPKCTKNLKFPVLFNSTLDSELVPVIQKEEFLSSHNITSCCYRNGWRDNGDYGYKLSHMCHPIALDGKTNVGEDHEFIAIFCVRQGDKAKDCVDVQAFVPLKPEVEKRPEMTAKQSKEKPNVVIMGLDAMSRANMLRMMPRSHEFLMNVMGAVEMQGYNKVGAYTIPNLSQMLTSHTLSYLKSTCAKNNTFDACSFIWKDFSKNGYRTSFNEDTISATFNGLETKHRGFTTQPTDYYMRTFTHMTNVYFWSRQRRESGCQGPRLFFHTLMDYMKKFIYRMNKENKPFFYFTWEGSLTHDNINDAALADAPMLETLSWLQENKQLDNTIFILVSDHGMQKTKFFESLQGTLEDRLPFMYFVFPDWFKEKYSRAIDNLRGNTKRLTTTLDIYYTLQDILNLDNISNEIIPERERVLDSQFVNETKMKPPPKGISLFLPIPPTRTCRHTSIEPDFCTCTNYAPIHPVHYRDVREASRFVLKELNNKMQGFIECKKLQFSISRAKWKLDPIDPVTYLINFKRIPGREDFNVEVARDNGTWKITRRMMKTSQIENDAWCLSNKTVDIDVKELCWCERMNKKAARGTLITNLDSIDNIMK